MLHDFAGRFFVFHEREPTLEALRIALPRDRTIDLGRQILLRNEALRASAKIWYHTRSHLTPLKDLWVPLLHRRYPEDDLHERGRGMIRLYQMILRSLNPPASSNAVGLTSNDSWRSRIGYELELSESLSLELEAGEPQERRRPEADRALEVYNEPRHGSAPFHFELRGVTNFDERRIATINAMLCVPSHKSGAARCTAQSRSDQCQDTVRV